MDVTMNADGSVTLSGGQVIRGVHQDGACYGEFCPLHNPSEHKYRDYPLYFNGVHMIRKTADSVVVDPDDYEFMVSGEAIVENSAKCLQCGDKVKSEFRHDFTTCSCGNVSVDGGYNYIRHLFKSADTYEDTSVIFMKEVD